MLFRSEDGGCGSRTVVSVRGRWWRVEDGGGGSRTVVAGRRASGQAGIADEAVHLYVSYVYVDCAFLNLHLYVSYVYVDWAFLNF